MEKEGLSGRTLTLKLKTASFEVRTRAVTLQNHINSSEDILNHASKLLKAELPLSLRLIGIRMSHFNDEKAGSSDPTQRKLTSFIVPGGDSAKLTCSDSSVSASTSNANTQILVDAGVPSPVDVRDACLLDSLHNWESDNQADSNQLLLFEQKHDITSNMAGETEHSFINLRNECHEVAAANPTGGGLGMLESKSFSNCSETTYVNELNNQVNNLDEEVTLSSIQKQETQNLWVDVYKCALCGAELPPNFVEERQEHSDYHLAEMLQQEESEQNKRYIMPRQRTYEIYIE